MFLNFHFFLNYLENRYLRHSQRNVWAATGSFSFLDLVVISRNIEILNYIVENYKETITPEVLGEGIEVEYDESGSSSEKVVSQDIWIFGATLIHFAAKFMPKGLELLLSTFENNKPVDTKSKHGLVPLHVAARNNDSLSTR